MLKNEPMDTGELLYDYEEEGEIHSSGDEENWKEKNSVKSTSIFGNTSGKSVFDNSDEIKKMERAKRFSIPFENAEVTNVNTETLSGLHKSLGIDKENEKHYRFNAIHVRGTQDMSTEDVFEYFSNFAPSYVEWINDVSCNVVWTDDISAAKTLINISKSIKNLEKIRLNANPFEKELKDEKEMEVDYEDEDAVDAREIKTAIPPGFWRLGAETEKSPAILLRFATRSDKKQKNAEKNSEYYKRYGNPHFGNLPGLVSKSLRNGVFRKYNKNQYDNMDSEERNGRKNPWGDLAQEWNELDEISDQSRGVRSRISLKRPHPSHQEDLRMSINSKYKQKYLARHSESGESSSELDDDYDNKESRLKYPRMKMYADEEEKIEINSNRTRLSSQVKTPAVEDLRNKIDRRRRNKEMLDSQNRQTGPGRYWNKFSTTEEEDNDDYDEEDNEEKGSNWALEQYSDLRESLQQNKTRNSKHKTISQSDSEGNKSDDECDMYNGHLGQRSPLQIEIENDEYFENESDNTL